MWSACSEFARMEAEAFACDGAAKAEQIYPSKKEHLYSGW